MNVVLVIIDCVAIFLLLILSAFFSAVDMTYSCVSLPRLKNAASKSKKAKLAYTFASHYEETIVAPLFGNSVVNILASSLATLLSYQLFGDMKWGTFLMSAVMLLLTLTFGEILPKALSKAYSYNLALFFAYPLQFFRILFFPITFVSRSFAQWVTRPFLEKSADEEDVAPSDDELQAMVDDIASEGIIDANQKNLLSSSIEFKDTTAYEIMTPRVKIEGISDDTDLNEYVKSEGAFRHSRIPVYHKNYDHIVGYIPVKTLLREMLSSSSLSMKDLIKPMLSVPKTMQISAVLSEMKKTSIHIAIVKDEYGGTDGLLTMEDILEELVGEIYDESEHVQPDVQKTAKKNVYLVRGAMDIEDFFERFHLDEDALDEDYETVSGWINDKLGRFGAVGDELRYGKVDITVKKATDYTITEIEVHYHPRRKIKEED